MNITRTELHEKLPLTTPFSLHVFPAYYCNFKCSYCLHSLSKDELTKLPFRKQLMELRTFKRATDNLKEFSEKLKAMIFAGHGEPLMNQDIDKMVEYAKRNDVAERIEIVTNGALLTPDMSDRLISAGLDRLRISIQGVTAQKYKHIAGVDLDFDEFLNNLRYFNSKRISTQVYIKIIDIALENKEEEKRFHELFAPLGDVVAIEYTIPFVSEIDYSVFNSDYQRCKQGHTQRSKICSMPFYMLVLEPNGNIVPCCSTSVPMVYGNINETNLQDVWNSSKLREFLRLQLLNKDENLVCKKCSVPAFGLQQGDYLDGYADKLLKYYE